MLQRVSRERRAGAFTYEHYLRTFLRPEDVFWSFVEAVIIVVAVLVSHCYNGFNASGGPVGVGEAVGRSMRFSLVSVQVVVLLGHWRSTVSTPTSRSRYSGPDDMTPCSRN